MLSDHSAFDLSPGCPADHALRGHRHVSGAAMDFSKLAKEGAKKISISIYIRLDPLDFYRFLGHFFHEIFRVMVVSRPPP